MAEEHDEQLPVEVEAALEIDPKPAMKRGLASLRGVKRTVYMRRSLLRVLAMAPEERAAFQPRNGFEELAKALVDAPSKGREGAQVIAVWREIRNTLGERTDGNNGRSREQHDYTVICDLPRPDRGNVN